MAKISVVAANGQPTTYEGSHSVTDGGVLTVTPTDGNKVSYSPSGWLYLEVLEKSPVPEVTGIMLS